MDHTRQFSNDQTLDIVLTRYVDLVQILAVLSPCFGGTRVPEVLGQAAAIRMRWRTRVAALKALGYAPLVAEEATANHALLMRDCRPTFAITGSKGRCCHRNYICPFCW